MFGYAFITFGIGGAAFQLTGPIESDLKLVLSKITFVALLFLFGLLSADLVLTRYVRLYRERAVKTYWILGDIVCILENSNVTFVSYIYGKRLWIVPKNLPRFFNPLAVFKNRIAFDCGLTNRKDIKRLKEVLQSLGIKTEGAFN